MKSTRQEISMIHHRGQSILSDFKRTISGINKNDELSDKEKRRMIQAHYQKAQPKISGHVDELISYISGIMAVADDVVKASRELDPEVARTRAAIIGPALAAMSHEQLFEFYKARASDKTDRRISEEILLTRFDSNIGDSRNLELAAIESKYNNIQPRIREQLTSPEKEALKTFEECAGLAGYAENIAGVLETQFKGLSRDLNTEESISLKRRQQDIKNYEEGPVPSGTVELSEVV